MKPLPTLREQIAARCVHFTGIGDKACKANVPYVAVRDESARPYAWPCVDVSIFGGRVAATTCAQKRLPTPEEAEAEEREWRELIEKEERKR